MARGSSKDDTKKKVPATEKKAPAEKAAKERKTVRAVRRKSDGYVYVYNPRLAAMTEEFDVVLVYEDNFAVVKGGGE